MNNRKGSGRPNAATYVASWGDTIDGAYQGKDGKLRPIGKARPAFSLNDERRAVHRFKRWQSEQGDDACTIDEFNAMSDSEQQAHVSRSRMKPHNAPPTIARMSGEHLQMIIEDERDRLRNLILTNPKQAAIEFRIEHLAWYPAMPEKPQYTLTELGDEYLTMARNKQGKPLAPKHIANSRFMWNQFCDEVNVTYPRELTKQILVSYTQFVEKLKLSASSVRNRYVKIKAILNWGIKKTDDEKDLRFALDLCSKVFDLPEVESNPQPIEPEIFHKLIDNADERMKAILLLGLNAAMHGGEIVDLLNSEIQLDKRTLSTRRHKNRNPRVAWLWKRTVRAIQDYQEKYPHNLDVLFASYPTKSRRPIPLTSEARRQAFVVLRDKLGISSTITTEGLRDAAYTIAEESDAHHAKFIAGHKTGMSDKYVLRQATNKKVVACCEAIEEHFFRLETK